MQSLSAYLQTFTTLDVVNIALALLVACLALSSINLMGKVATHRDVMDTIVRARGMGSSWWDAVMEGVQSAPTLSLACAQATLAAGAFGQALALGFSRWQVPVDTLFWCGLAATAISNRRGLLAAFRCMPAVSFCLTGLGWLVFFGTVT